MHGVRRELLEAQATAAGLALVEVGIPTPCSNEVYERRMAQMLASSVLAPAEAVAFGDLFLEDVRAYGANGPARDVARQVRLSLSGAAAAPDGYFGFRAVLAHPVGSSSACSVLAAHVGPIP
jgi:hypothetical protein